jgi:hypothetical protein
MSVLDKPLGFGPRTLQLLGLEKAPTYNDLLPLKIDGWKIILCGPEGPANKTIVNKVLAEHGAEKAKASNQ